VINTQEYLPHLKNAVPNKGYGNRLSMYLIALEAWRRGLAVKFFLEDNPDNKLLIRYSIGDGTNKYKFESSLGEKLSAYAYEVCENKDETKKVLSEAGIPVPEGKRFTADVSDNEIIEYANELGFPLVMKPISENAGKGVFSNIKTMKEFEESLLHLRNELNYQDIIVEKHVDGIEYRIFLVDGKVIAATNRIPANIKGDGINTIEQLIGEKNKSKLINPSVASKFIEQDKEVSDAIRALGYEYTSVPAAGEQIFLREKSNVSAGGDSIDVTNQLTPELKKIAENASQAIDGLNVCGLDMIVDKELNNGVIIEINTKPMIGLHIFPVEGEPRDVVSPILDAYFPATVGKKKTNFYFDFDAVIAPLRDRSVREVTLSPPPIFEQTFATKYLLRGSYHEDFERKVRLLALRERVHGYLKEVEDEQYELVIVSDKKQVVHEFIQQVTLLKLVSNSHVEEYEYDLPIKIGFEIYKKSGTQKRIKQQRDKIQQQRDRIKRLNQDLRNQKALSKKYKEEIIADRRQNSILGKRILKAEKQNEKYLKKNEKIIEKNLNLKMEYQNVIDSNSWKLTKPMRKIGKIMKKN